jgi:hypothetical protein
VADETAARRRPAEDSAADGSSLAGLQVPPSSASADSKSLLVACTVLPWRGAARWWHGLAGAADTRSLAAPAYVAALNRSDLVVTPGLDA